jgi:hypothetical protein
MTSALTAWTSVFSRNVKKLLKMIAPDDRAEHPAGAAEDHAR